MVRVIEQNTAGKGAGDGGSRWVGRRGFAEKRI